MTSTATSASRRAYRAAHQRRRRRLMAYGQWNPEAEYTSPERARRHIADLKERYGISEMTIAHLAGYGPHVKSLQALTRPDSTAYRTKISLDTERRILGVKFDLDALPDTSHVSAAGTHRRLEALAVMGWPLTWVAAQMGVSRQLIFGVMHDRERVTAAQARRVRDIFDAHWDTPGPSKKAKTWATKNGYVGPLAWDDLDDATERPNMGDPVDGRHGIHIEDVEFLLTRDAYTWEGLATRLGLTRSAIEQRLYRAGRRDLTDQLTTNTHGYRKATA